MKPAGMFFLGLITLAGSLAIAEIQNVLHFTKIAGYHHKDGIIAGKEALDKLAKKYGFKVKHSGDEAEILNLSQYDVVIFNNNVANGGGQSLLPTKLQQQALIDYMEGGGSYLGFHGAVDYDCTGWEWYHETLYSGNCFRGHGGGTWTLEVDQDLIADPELSAMWEDAHLWKTVTFKAEKSRTRKDGDPSVRDDPDVKVMQKLIEDNSDYHDHYFTWTKRIGKGRMIFTAIGAGEGDWKQNDSWLQRATWFWMKYLDGQYANPLKVRIENWQSETVRTMPLELGRARFYLINGQIVATRSYSIHPGFDFFRTPGPGIYFGKIKYSSGFTIQKLIIPIDK